MYEDTLTKGETAHSLQVLLTWEALQLRRSLAEFILLLAMSFGAVALVEYSFGEDHEAESAAETTESAVGTIGALLFFLLTVRLNTCLSRWWEGRCLWGKLIYARVLRRCHAAPRRYSLNPN